jgi:hypothetical protein
MGTRSITSNANGILFNDVFVSGGITVGNITIANANAGNSITSNLSVSGFLKTNLVPDISNTYNLGNSTNRFKDLYLSGNTLILGTATIQDDGSGGIAIQSAVVSGNLNVGNVSAAFLVGSLTSSSQPSITEVGILNNLSVQGNTTTGALSVVGNLEAASLTTNTITATNISGNLLLPPGTTLQAPGGNTQILFNDGGNTNAVPGMTFNRTNNILSIQGNVEGGNLITSGGLSVTGTGTVGNLISGGNITATGTANVGNLITVGILASSANIDGNVATTGFLTVAGNASMGNITTTTLSGAVVSVSGNISGANLVASGVLRVDGNANVGNLTTSGLVSAATIQTALLEANSLSSNTTISAVGNITGGNLLTNGSLNVTGLSTFANTVAGNMVLNGALTGAATIESGLINVTGNMIGGNVLTNGFLSVIGNATVGNISTAGLISATGNINAGNLVTSGSLSASSGSLTTMIITSLINAASATANVGSVNSSILSVVGNATAGNLSTQGILSVTGNATVGNVSTGIVTTSSSLAVGTDATIGNSLTVSGNLLAPNISVTNLNAASFVGTTANLSNININTGGIITMPNGNANIGNIAAGILQASGNLIGGNLITNGYLAVSGDASLSNVSIANAIVNNNYNVGGQVVIGANLAIQASGSSGNGSVAVMRFSSTQPSAPFPTGQTVIVSGLLPSGFNGTYTVLTSNTTHFTYSSSTSGTVTQGGFVRSSGTGLILQSTASVGNLLTGGNISASGNITGGTFTATLFSGNGASITGINMFNAGMSVVVTATAGTGTVSTLSFAPQPYPPFSPGQQIVVTGVTPPAYQGTYIVQSCTTTSVTVPGPATGAMTQSGVITGGPKSQTSVSAETIINGSQPNITSVGTLTGLTLTGAFSGTDMSVSGYMFVSVQNGIAAAGTTLSTATGLTRQVNVITSATSGVNDGIRLPSATVGQQIIIINRTGTGIKVWPANGARIDLLGLNTSFTLGNNARLMCIATAIDQWYTMVGVYG